MNTKGKRRLRKGEKRTTGRSADQRAADRVAVRNVQNWSKAIWSELKNFRSDTLSSPDFAADMDAALQLADTFPKSSIENCRVILVNTIPRLERKFGQTDTGLTWHPRIDRLKSLDAISQLSAIMMHSLLNLRDEVIYHQAQLGPSEAKVAIYLLVCALRSIVPTAQSEGTEGGEKYQRP